MAEETDAREPMLPVGSDEVQAEPMDLWDTEEVRERLEGGQVVERITKRTRPLGYSRSRPRSTPLGDGEAFTPRAPATGSAFLNHSGFSAPMDFQQTGPADPDEAHDAHDADDIPDAPNVPAAPDAPDGRASDGSSWQAALLHQQQVLPLPAAQGQLRHAETLDEALSALHGRTPHDIARTVAQRVRHHPLSLAVATSLVLVLCVGMSTLLMLTGSIPTPSVLVLTTPTSCPICPATPMGNATGSTGSGGAVATATAGTGGSGCCDGGTPHPTDTPGQKSYATPTSLPTTPPGAPTSTPIPYASSATMHFTATSQTLASDGAMTSCTSGCTLPAKTTSGSTGASATQATTGWTQSSLGGTVAVELNPDSAAGWSDSGSFSVCAGGNCCGVSGTWYSGTINYFTCTWYPGWTSYVSSGGWSGSGSAGQNCAGTAIEGPCSFSWWNSSPLTASGYATVTYTDCHNAINSAESKAQSAANSAISSALSGWSVVGKSISADQNAWTCSPAIGQAGSSVTGGARANYAAIGYHPSDAQTVASQRITALLPGDDYWSSSPSTCTPSASANGTSTITITCSDAGIATYDWRSSSTVGQGHQAALLGSVSGQTTTAATSTCNSTIGIVANSCSISTAGSSGWMPTSSTSITLLVA